MKELKRVFDLQLFAEDDGSDAGGDDKGNDKSDNTGGDDEDSKKKQDSGDAGGKTKFSRSDKKQDDQDSGDAGGKKDDKEDDDRLFTQEELDAVVTRRLARAEKNWQEKMEAEKKKAAMSEAERLKAEKEEAEKKAAAATDRANQRLIRSEVIAQATKMNVVDPDAAFALMDREGITIDDDDNVKGVKEALEILVKAKPYLIKQEEKGQRKTGDDQGDDKGKKGGISMNDLIRKAAGRA